MQILFISFDFGKKNVTHLMWKVAKRVYLNKTTTKTSQRFIFYFLLTTKLRFVTLSIGMVFISFRLRVEEKVCALFILCTVDKLQLEDCQILIPSSKFIKYEGQLVPLSFIDYYDRGYERLLRWLLFDTIF